MTNTPDQNSETQRFHHVVSKNALSLWGIENVSYVKRTVVKDQSVWAVYGAEGTLLTITSSREAAFALIKQLDLEPMSAH